MTTTTETKLTKPVQSKEVDPLSIFDTQKQVEEVAYKGIFTVGAVETYEYQGKSGLSGFVQILQKQRDDSAALELLRIKVPEEKFGFIDELNKKYRFKPVTLNCVVSEGYGGKFTRTLSLSQPFFKSE